MKASWVSKSLRDVCEIDKSQGVHKDLPYVGLEHIEAATGKFLGTTEPTSVKSSTFRFSRQHLLYGRLRPYLNKVMSPEFEGHCSTEIFPIKPKDDVLREFLQYWFLRAEIVSAINATSTGTRMPRANMNEVFDFEFMLPPLPEQRRIVGILDEAFDGIATAKANAEKNLQNARALFESYLDSVFNRRGTDWNDTRLGEICGFQNGFAFKSKTFKSSGVPVLRISNIQDGRVDLDKIVYIDPNDYRENLERYRVIENDLLIAMSGATTGKLGFNTEANTFFLNQRVGKFEPGCELNKRFLYYYLTTKVDYNLRISAGAAQPNLSTEQIKEFAIPLPPINDQARIVASMDSLSVHLKGLEDIYRRKRAALDELKKSLLHRAFSGQL